jgi:DNA-3-methyladenine glycosylase
MRLDKSFYERDVLTVAPELIGKTLIRFSPEGLYEYVISEVEAYGGTEDKASHARFGKTTRNSIMFNRGGLVYVYFIYGMYWMLNIVTGKLNHPQAILIRSLMGVNGPGKVAKKLAIDKTFYGEDLTLSERLWIEDRHIFPVLKQSPRFGINYAGEPWKSMPWRYLMVQPPQIS